MCCRFVATGDSFRTIATSFRVGGLQRGFHRVRGEQHQQQQLRDLSPLLVWCCHLPGLRRVALQSTLGERPSGSSETCTSYFSAEGTLSWHDTII
ncbi:unnamed protein product [Boreogadus saida]